ncbi:MAG: hypothetical protein A2Y17_02340 [Clostridiales bacterium GWF2_38_85]|nr:MAG: hypothetical protein A2Y17_02340 [Clostridiales bacterium GWF2_38_85]HBL85037.1 hypothetical protein [Clostridiales bacterium]
MRGWFELDREELFASLKNVVQNGFKILPELDFYELNDAMIEHIGDTDPSLRDELICEVFYEWLSREDLYLNSYLEIMMNRLTSNTGLFYDTGGYESVFTRTFSSLIIGQIITRHQHIPFLKTNQLLGLVQTVHTYCQIETNYSGYHDIFGWAHAGAHIADVIDILSQCHELGSVELELLLDCISLVLNNGDFILAHEEDERLARAALHLYMNSSMNNTTFNIWLERLSSNSSGVQDMKPYRNRVNAKNFVRSLYFKALHFGIETELQDILLKSEERLNRYVLLDRKYFDVKCDNIKEP